MLPELDAFLAGWSDDELNMKPLFLSLYHCLSGFSPVELEYRARAGVSHSLRAKHPGQKKRDLFVLVDIIDDDPKARWLSVCFYADLVTDTEERGDIVPGGLMGEDACCFDVDENGVGMEAFLLERLREAYAKAPQA